MRAVVLRDEEPPNDATIVVRGGLLLAESIRRTAERCRREYGFLGLSVYGAVGMTVIELTSTVPQIGPTRYRQVRVSTFGAVRQTGFPIWPTNSAQKVPSPAFQLTAASAWSSQAPASGNHAL